MGIHQESITIFFYYILLICTIQFLHLNTSCITDFFDLWCKPDQRTSDSILHCVSGKVHFFKTILFLNLQFRSHKDVQAFFSFFFFWGGEQEKTKQVKNTQQTSKKPPGFVPRRCFKNNSGKKESFTQDIQEVWILASLHSRVKQVSILCFLLLRAVSYA